MDCRGTDLGKTRKIGRQIRSFARAPRGHAKRRRDHCGHSRERCAKQQCNARRNRQSHGRCTSCPISQSAGAGLPQVEGIERIVGGGVFWLVQFARNAKKKLISSPDPSKKYGNTSNKNVQLASQHRCETWRKIRRCKLLQKVEVALLSITLSIKCFQPFKTRIAQAQPKWQKKVLNFRKNNFQSTSSESLNSNEPSAKIVIAK